LRRIYVHLPVTSADVEVARILRLAEITRASSRRENKSTSLTTDLNPTGHKDTKPAYGLTGLVET